MANPLMTIVQNAIGEGKLMPQNYSDAIRVSRDPEVTEYLEGLLAQEAVPVVEDKVLDDNTLELIDVDTEQQESAASTDRRAKAQLQRETTVGEEATDTSSDRRTKAQEQREANKITELKTPDPEGTKITLEDIQSSETLRKLGVVPGDRFLDDEIIRVFSNEEDNVDIGYRITQQDIINSPTLQSLNSQVGDRVVGDEIISSNIDNTWMQFKYGFSEDQGFLADVGDFLEANIPIGEIKFDFNVNSFEDVLNLPLNMASYSSPDELYGEGFSAATPDQRRDMIIAKKERELLNDYGQFFQPSEDSIARTAGNVTAILADPTTLAPAGQSLKAMSAIGAAVAGSGSVANDLATTGVIDWEKAGLTTVAGGALAPIMGKAVRTISNRSADKGAKKLQTKAQAVVDTHIATGGSREGITDALIEAGINPQSLGAATQRTGNKLNIAGSASRAEQALKDAIVRDSATSRIYSKTLDRYLGSISTRIGNISESAKGALRRFDFDSHVNTAAVSKVAEPFLIAMKALPTATKKALNKHLANGNFKAAEGLMRSVNPAMQKEFQNNIKPLLTKIGTDLKAAGHTFEVVENYFPRVVRDYDKLRKKLGQKEQGYITKQLQDYARKKNIAVGKLSDQERSEIIDLAMRGYRQTTDGGKISFAKQRQIDELTDDLMDEYAPPEEALAMYLRNSVADIEKRKFFGRSKSAELDENGRFTTEGSIGAMIRKAIDDGDLLPEREQEMFELLQARFIGGEQSPSGVASTIRDLGYMGTIANPISAITQLADVGIASALKGFRNAIGSMFGTKNLKVVDLGLEDVVTKELSDGDPRKTAKALNKLMGLAAFKWTDRLGKETLINASFKKAQQMVKSVKGEAAFRKKIGNLYGKETESLIADLKAGDITENVKFFAFNELADVQPISLSEMPEKYLTAKNGRLLYMLKSFTLKQIDMVRREVVQEWKRGNKLEASKKAALLAGYLSTANMGTQAVKDTLLGREVFLDDVPDKAIWALLGGFGMSEYTWDKYLSQGKIIEGGIDYLTPATPVIEALLTLGYEITEEDPDFSKVLKGIPYTGPILYSYLGGGAEKYNERQEKRREERD